MSAEPQLQANTPQSRLLILERIIPLFALVLLAVTWPLWWGNNSFPSIPLLPGIQFVPFWIDRLCVVLLLPALVGLLVLPARLRMYSRLQWGVPLLWLLLILLDQQRLQTWSYQFSLMLLLVSGRSISTGRDSLSSFQTLRLLQILTVSIYVFSALSKLDYHFITGGGFFLTQGMLDLLGINTNFWPESRLSIVTSVPPLFELIVGVGLLFRWSQRYALVGSLVLHVMLLLVLGPWGLDHSAGVLIWNLFFLVQNLILFRLPRHRFSHESVPANPDDPGPVADGMKSGGTKRFAYVLVGLVVLLPLLEPWGYWDHWPSWAVYASRQERFLILLEDSIEQPAPAELTPYLSAPRPLETTRLLNLNSWSLSTRNVPVYPQARFQWGLWKALRQRYPNLQMTVRLESMADRFSGERERESFTTADQIESLKSRFWLNAEPRDFSGK